MQAPKLTPYNKVCVNCGEGREKGILEYMGNGKFVHLIHKPNKVRQARPPKVIKPIREATVVQCICKASEPNLYCPYNEN